MLHRGTLALLCRARRRLRQPETDRLSVKAVAAEMGMSQFHLIRLYRSVFGETPKQCQLRARLERAKDLLVLTEASVTEISLEAGFSSLGTFSSVFHRRLGASPTAYRKAIRPLVTVPGQRPAAHIPGCLSLMTGPAS